MFIKILELAIAIIILTWGITCVIIPLVKNYRFHKSQSVGGNRFRILLRSFQGGEKTNKKS
jgi:hypothetical protein